MLFVASRADRKFAPNRKRRNGRVSSSGSGGVSQKHPLRTSSEAFVRLGSRGKPPPISPGPPGETGGLRPQLAPLTPLFCPIVFVVLVVYCWRTGTVLWFFGLPLERDADFNSSGFFQKKKTHLTADGVGILTCSTGLGLIPRKRGSAMTNPNQKRSGLVLTFLFLFQAPCRPRAG